MNDPMADTADLTVPERKPEAAGHVASGSVDVRIGGASHRGRVRPNNEDCYLVARFSRSLETLLTNAPEEYLFPRLHEVGYGMLVADGMGGPAAGEVASRSAIQTLSELLRDTKDWIFADDDAQLEQVMTRMEARFREVDRLLLRKAHDNPAYTGMGTTLTLAFSLGFDVILCHIGDTRAYVYRDGALEQLTRDMTVAQDMIDMGLLDPVEKRVRGLGHVLTQCLGLGDARAHVQRRVLRDRDRLLLCSDGLSEMLADPQIAEILRGSDPPEITCQRLVHQALQKGGIDNITVVLADYRRI